MSNQLDEAWIWRLEAACRGMDTNIFFPSKGKPANAAKVVCARCLVAAECLDFAMANDQYDGDGIYGGLTPRQRRARRPAYRRALAS